MPAGAQTHRLINTSKPMSFTITTDRATTPRARTLLDIFRHKRNRPNRLPRSPSRASASRNRPVGGGLPMVEQSGHHVDVTAPGVIEQRVSARGSARRTRLPLATSISGAMRTSPVRAIRGSRQGEDRCRAWGDHEAVRRGRGRPPPSRRDRSGRERLPPYAIGDVRRLRRVDHIDRLEPWILYIFEQRLAVPE